MNWSLVFVFVISDVFFFVYGYLAAKRKWFG